MLHTEGIRILTKIIGKIKELSDNRVIFSKTKVVLTKEAIGIKTLEINIKTLIQTLTNFKSPLTTLLKDSDNPNHSKTGSKRINHHNPIKNNTVHINRITGVIKRMIVNLTIRARLQMIGSLTIKIRLKMSGYLLLHLQGLLGIRETTTKSKMIKIK
jgi:hypothetical protein